MYYGALGAGTGGGGGRGRGGRGERGGGGSSTRGNSIAVDQSGAATYTGGSFAGNLTIVLRDGTTTSLFTEGSSDILLIKEDTVSGKTIWAKGWGGLGEDVAVGVAVGASGVYVTGSFTQDMVIPLIGGGNATLSGTNERNGDHLFVFHVDPTSGGVVWAKSFGGNDLFSVVQGSSIAVNATGATYIAGSFVSSWTAGSTTITSDGSLDAFVLHLSAAGEAIWLWSCGGPGGNDVPYGLALGPGGVVNVVGYFTTGSMVIGDYNGGSIELVTSAGAATFVLQLSAGGNGAHWAQAYGGDTSDSYGIGYGLAVSPLGAVYAVGQWGDASQTMVVPMVDGGNTTLVASGFRDAFLMKLDDSTGK